MEKRNIRNHIRRPSPKHNEDYVFVEKQGEDFTAYKLISGPFADIVYKYGKVGICTRVRKS